MESAIARTNFFRPAGSQPAFESAIAFTRRDFDGSLVEYRRSVGFRLEYTRQIVAARNYYTLVPGKRWYR